jgi:hypothetical protein
MRLPTEQAFANGPLPRDRAYWADTGYGEIVRVRYAADSCAPWPHFDQCDDGDAAISDGDTRQIGSDEITDWDDDRGALASRVEA